MPATRFITLVSGIQTEVVPATTGGGGSANQIPALDASGLLASSMMPAGLGLDTVSLVTSAAISAGTLVNIYNVTGTPTVRPADNTTTGSEANAFSLSAVSSGATGTFFLSGNITGLTGLTSGAIMFLGTVGALTATAPSTAGNIVQIVGKALGTTSVAFNPQQYTVLA